MIFELTNSQRPFLGLNPVKKNWDLVQLSDSIFLYFEGDEIKKKISVTGQSYQEFEMAIQTRNREFLLPQTPRGKEKKLSVATLQAYHPSGMYFQYTHGLCIKIGNNGTNREFYNSYFEELEVRGFDELSKWIEKFIFESTPQDKEELHAFRAAKRIHQKYRVGDFFAFPAGRRLFGFGRILLDISILKKQGQFKMKKHYGLKNLMCRPLVVSVYHLLHLDKNLPPEKIITGRCCPSQYITDDDFYYGDNLIIGNLPLEASELDFPVSYSKSISALDGNTVYLQWGEIYLETNIKKYNKYLRDGDILEQQKNTRGMGINPFRNEGIGMRLNVRKSVLEQCIRQNSNTPYWKMAPDYEHDLRNPKFENYRKEIFSHFGLAPDKSYSDNLLQFSD